MFLFSEQFHSSFFDFILKFYNNFVQQNDIMQAASTIHQQTQKIEIHQFVNKVQIKKN